MNADVLFPINAEAFTYLVPDELQGKVMAGSRVSVPFKRSYKVGIVTSVGGKGLKDPSIKLRKIKEVLDEKPFLPENILELIKWTGQYYMSVSGLALKNAVPSAFFTGKKPGKSRIKYSDTSERKEIVELTDDQKRVLSEINAVGSGAFMLHGVTGCGKTEVYMNAIKALPEGREAIVLVPEIAITAQMIDRFRAGFGEDVVFYHSGLSTGERIRQWENMRDGKVRVVIGVRSAVFAPFQNLGLIVVDEEQEASYKQFEGLRYNARDTALARAKLEKIKIILGSATPSLEAFYAAKSGRFKYLEITKRIDNKTLPAVEVIDMTKEKKQTFSFSNRLLNLLKETISAGQQSLIMLNRRGYAPFYICTECGHTYKCPSCSITLIYHNDTHTLNCHYCGSFLKPKAHCPECNATGVKYLGTGTQRVEEELRKLLPELALTRMDRDTTRKKLSHHTIIKDMEDRKIDMLLGTQMVAKGHDFPAVTLAVVVSADIALNLPDFRSGERAFQLFTQLAGRAGRGDVSGRAVIQTYEPEHYVFEYVKQHDYNGFYKKEIKLRKELAYPPYSRLIRIVLSFKTKETAEKTIKVISNRIKRITPPAPPLGKVGISEGIQILGPVPAPIEKIRSLWRWHFVLKGRDLKPMRQMTRAILEKIGDIKEVKIDIDVDPVNLM